MSRLFWGFFLILLGGLSLPGSTNASTSPSSYGPLAMSGSSGLGFRLKPSPIVFLKGNGQRTTDDAVGCCCLLKDTGPPPNWDCTGSNEGTEVTKAQCDKDADDTGAKSKWHPGKCTGKE
jgi:hypothetical protein